MDASQIKYSSALRHAVDLVHKHGFSISDTATSCQISKQALYRAVRAHNTPPNTQLDKLIKKKEKLQQQLRALEIEINQLTIQK
ncbi:hypothetical protein [Pseudoalteromonas sp. Of7M-16]|uniref:hypothetical protein n=1 Tax=Pseudoalteromonas sp. Of7M-16 TaxID=2917756 RepID=UPI001EF408E9|nr:hypothetical protein [Pseudoalteromonas sp. Of7M-16]MCG7547055.1 hypothetical protein [Pseudoalteromonas sp. Of7M-16]